MAYKNKEDAKKWRENNKKKIKEYNKTYQSEYYQKNKEKIDNRNKEWHKNNPLKQREYSKKCYHKNGNSWAKGDQELIKARRKTRTLVDNGTIEKKNHCEYCNHDGSIFKIEKHHEDYNKPLEVTWLCSKCHKNLHAGNISLAE